MWSPVQATGAPLSSNRGSPVTRCKHAMCVTLDGHIYLYGGRSANLPLKDLWRFDSGQNQWEEVKCRGQHPPNLQEHTMVAWNNKLYVFGGEIGFSSNGETPLWILDLATTSWRKQTTNPSPSVSSGMQPTGRRGHSAVLYGDAMHVYGGYQDLRGSSSELWTFDFITEQWHLMSDSGSSNDHPAPRHTHSAVMHNNCMYIYGGMTDLNVRSDFWKWDFGTRLWHRIKANKGPGELYGHTAIKAFNSMFIFGGERSGNLLRDLWRFHFGTEIWERINTEGVVPNSRCRHVAIANPFLDSTAEEEETNNKILRLSSKPNRIPSSQSQNQSKALVAAPTKSISMCFGQPTDTPLHENGKALKQFKFRVHPMSVLCSGRSATLSDDDDDLENNLNAIINENYGNDNVVEHLNHRNSQVTMRKSLKEKISHSRLVRSISSSSYNILHQNGLTAEELKDELERLVEESTPQMQRQNPIGPSKAGGNYRRLKNRSKMQKSISSNAVLESDSESSTPQHHCSNRPLSEVIQTQSIGVTPLEDDLNNESWMKRRTVHESMSYYSLCFPSPPSHSKSGSESSTTSIDNNHHLPHRFEAPLLSEFEEDLENGNVPQTEANSISPDSGKENVTTTLIELDDHNANITIASPVDGRPKSSGYNSSLTLYTPSIESRGISHSVSHSSGYHSFTDESMYEHRDFAGALQQTTVIPRRTSGRQVKDIHALMELKNLNGKISEQIENQVAENGNALPSLRLSKETRARSLDRASIRRESRQNLTPSSDNTKMSWQPNINVIKEVVVPGSPASHMNRGYAAPPMGGPNQMMGSQPSPNAISGQPMPSMANNSSQSQNQPMRGPLLVPQRNIFQSPSGPTGYVSGGPQSQRYPQSHHIRMGSNGPPFGAPNVRTMVPPPPQPPQGLKRPASAMTGGPGMPSGPTKGLGMGPMGPPSGPTHMNSHIQTSSSKKKKKLSDKILPQKVRDLVPESQAYMDLLAFERKLDFTIMRKRLDIQEALKRPMKQKRKLRIFISNTFYPGKPEGDGSDEPSVPSWELRVEGRLLEDPNAPKADQSKVKRKFSSFFKSLVIELDKDLYGPDNHLVEWHRTPTTTETDGFQVKRPGDKNVRCTILLLLDYQPLQFKLDPRLARLLGIHTQTRPVIINALWQYIKTHKLQDAHEREFINCDKYLEQIFQCPRMKFAEIPSRLHHLLHPPDPIVINHLISVEGPDMKKTSCYDIDVEVDDPLKIQMNNFLLSTASQQEIQSLDNKIHETVETINQLKTNREFLLSFSTDPQHFINKWLISQMRDLKTMTDQVSNPEEERNSDFFFQSWTQEAVCRYFYGKVQQRRAELEQALGIRNA